MLRQMANIKNGLILLCVYALIVRLMLQRNNEIEAHDGRQSNKASFFNRVYDCSEKSDCQSYSEITDTSILLCTIYMQGRYEPYTLMPLLGGDISGAKFWQVCFDCPKLFD